jgi:hypothetical protein
MGPLINFLVFMVLLFVGLAQTKSVPPRLGYTAGGILAAVTMVLAVVRYRRDTRK